VLLADIRLVDGLSIGLGAVSLLVASLAAYIAIRSDNRLKAISDLEFFEKRAAMESYIGDVATESAHEEAALRRLSNDFAAIAALHKYASEERKSALITAVIPALERIVGQGTISAEDKQLTENLVAQAKSFGVPNPQLDDIAAALSTMMEVPNEVEL
jgi:hypothetical protein